MSGRADAQFSVQERRLRDAEGRQFRSFAGSVDWGQLGLGDGGPRVASRMCSTRLPSLPVRFVLLIPWRLEPESDQSLVE
ncbi:hypothetical protein NHH03_01500 [Stieleria sp. TO1_6]|nr:hypothetical protein [Stieleria tagensis]